MAFHYFADESSAGSPTNGTAATGTLTVAQAGGVQATHTITITNYLLVSGVLHFDDAAPGQSTTETFFATVGVHFNAEVSNNQTASNLATYLNGKSTSPSGTFAWTAVADGADVNVTLTAPNGAAGNGLYVWGSDGGGWSVDQEPSYDNFSGGEDGTTQQPSDGDTITIGSTTYRFKDTLAQEGDIKIGGDGSTTLGNLVKAIMQTGVQDTDYDVTSAHSTVTAVDNDPEIAITTSVAPSQWATIGNTIATTESADNYSWGGATLSGGTDSSAGGAGTIQVDDTYLYVASEEDVWKRVEVSSF